ncbi:MAG TPA: efflux RND transporter periplasmic adaptor subunit [Candidatus Tectomicrobia bacterium]|nr:efflux RND transporter periplasmic adaptor subunit [Candidatus Tectomicrobia bacterium]
MTQPSRTSLSWYSIALILSLLLMGVSACTEVKSASTQETPRAPAVTVTVIQVNPRSVPIYSEYTGTTDATETAEIRARVDGYVEKRLFDAGQIVKSDQLLYVLDQRTYNAELQRAKAGVAKAEADLRFAKEGVEVLRAESRLAQSRAALVKADQDVARYRPLVRQEAAPQVDLDASLAQQQVLREEVNARKAELDQTKLQQRTQIALAGAELEFARATQRLAELNLDYTEIKAPVNGRIGESNIFVGGLATKNSSNPLTLLSPLDPIQVKVRVGERDYLNYIKAGDEGERGRRVQELSLQLLLGDGSAYGYPGRFRSADRAVDPQTGTLELTLDFPNPALTLLPGTFSRVRVQTGEKSGVFLVPQRAIRELQGVRSLYLVDNEDKVVARTVTAADRLGGLWVIEKGLEAGDRVIVEGIQRVQPGVKVQYKVEPEPQPEQTRQSAAH